MSENENPNQAEQELAEAVDEALAEASALGNGADEVATLTADLQRLQAEYANYRKRVDRDREAAAELTTALLISQLLPVLDDIDRA